MSFPPFGGGGFPPRGPGMGMPPFGGPHFMGEPFAGRGAAGVLRMAASVPMHSRGPARCGTPWSRALSVRTRACRRFALRRAALLRAQAAPTLRPPPHAGLQAACPQ